MHSLLHDGLLEHEHIQGEKLWQKNRLSRRSRNPALDFGEEHGVGVIYGLINFVVCVPSLVSYAHIVFPFAEFNTRMCFLVKFYFLSSALIQAVFSLRSTIVFSVGQIQDVGLIFLAAMVKNIVKWSREDGLSNAEIVATSLWMCALSTAITGVCLVIIGKLKLSTYVQMLPLPVVGGYLGYIGYFCLAAGLSIGSGLELSGPETLLQLWDPELKVKMALLGGMTLLMLLVHFRVKHFLGMPIMLLALPVAFFVSINALGISIEECRQKGWLPPFDPSMMKSGVQAFDLYDMSLVQWQYIPRQTATVLGLVIIVSFGSSLDIAAIQAEMDGQKIDYNKELVTIGMSNLVSGACGGATGSYIFSQTIFSAKRGVKSRLNGWMVFVGELALFLLPVDILSVLPTCYIGGVMCLFGVDIMNDWLWQSRHLMAWTEYVLVWLSFTITMVLTSSQTFGVIEGMLAGTIIAAFFFAIQYTMAHEAYVLVATRSSVVRPPKENRVLNASYHSVMAVSLNSFAFFGASLHMAQGIEEEADRKDAKYVCLDFARLSGMDSTAADQMKQLVLSLERNGKRVHVSSVRSDQARRLLQAHGVIGEGAPRRVFGTLDMSLRRCEDDLLQGVLGGGRRASKLGGGRRESSGDSEQEELLPQLLLDYVDGFTVTPSSKLRSAEAARNLSRHFKRIEVPAGGTLFQQDDPGDYIYVVGSGSLALASHAKFYEGVGAGGFLPSPNPNCSGGLLYPSPPARSSVSSTPAMQASLSLGSGGLPRQISELELEFEAPAGPFVALPEDATSDRAGIGAILGDTAFYARRKNGCDAVAEGSGCVVYRIGRNTMEWLEEHDPALMVFLQKVLLRDLTQLQVQFLGPLQAAMGMS